KGERSKQFTQAVSTVRAALGSQSSLRFISGVSLNGPPVPVAVTSPRDAAIQNVPSVERTPEQGFWDRYQSAIAEEDRHLSRIDRAQKEDVTLARIAALMQILAPEQPTLRLGLVKHLSAV